MTEEQEKQLREKFSVVLGSPCITSQYYDSTKKRVIYSWEQIFFELGKLTQKSYHPNVQTPDYSGEVSDN